VKREPVLVGDGMRVWSLVAGAGFQTNCFVVAAPTSARCVIIDPGQGVMPALAELVEVHHLEPQAILLTHGHMDHTWDCCPAAEHFEVPVLVHPADRSCLVRPEDALPSTFPPAALAGYPRREPEGTHDLVPGTPLTFGDGRIEVLPAPGHTRGSVMLVLPGQTPGLVAGDSLLGARLGPAVAPAGDSAVLVSSVAHVRAAMPSDVLVLPGHGEAFPLADVPRTGEG
jgi:hydroxyacylglutathione hydrolase